MFKKKPTIKPLAPLRSSDRRKLAQQIISEFSALPVDFDNSSESVLRNALLPENTRSAKFSTTVGPERAPVQGILYVSEDTGRILWTKVGDEPMFPSVYTLWKNLSLLPVVHTHPPVIEKLCTGADLMTPGLIGPPFSQGARVGRLVGIAGSDKPGVPVAVGVCEIDVAGLEKTVGEKGRAVKLMHWVGDEIYKHGGPGTVPATLETENVTKLVRHLQLTKDDAMIKNQADESADSGEEEVRELSLKEIDDTFYSAVLYGFYDYSTQDKISSLEFPLSSSNFVSQLLHPYLPPASHFPPYNLLQTTGPHASLTIKKTSWKNAAKFLKHLEKLMLIKTKTRGGGEIVVLDISWDADVVKEFHPYRLPAVPGGHTASSAGHSAGSSGVTTIDSLYRPNGKIMKFFETIKVDPKGYYTSAELKQLLNTYIDSENLVQSNNKRIVTLDPVLSNTLYPATSPRTEKRDILAEKLIKSCSPYYTITTTNGTSKPKPGNLPKISIVIEKRQGKKTVTRIFGLEPFEVEPKGLAEELQRVCAGSATVGQAIGLKPGLLEVMVQGSQSKRKKVNLYTFKGLQVIVLELCCRSSI